MDRPAPPADLTAVATARFNALVNESLLHSCLDALRRHGVAEDRIGVVWVPGSFGILATGSVEQALDRAGLRSGEKGSDAAFAAIETINLLARREH